MSGSQKKERMRQYIKRQFDLPDGQIESMIPLFLATLGEHLENLEQACTAGDLKQLAGVGHTIKGALLNLGLREEAEIAQTIEQKGGAGEEDVDFQALVSTLRAALDEFFA